MSKYSKIANEAAKQYLKYLKARTVPIPYRTKAPKHPDWQHMLLDEAGIDKYFPPTAQLNIGWLLGAASSGLIDADLDCPEAVAMAPHFLPETAMRFGRKSTDYKSHWVYRMTGNDELRTKQFHDINRNAGKEGREKQKQMIVEVRGNGTQTVVPPSVHPSGEEIRFFSDDDPAEIDYDELVAATGRLAAAVILKRSWPSEGSRNDCALALAGAMLSNGCSVEFTEHFIGTVAEHAGDEEADSRVATVATTQKKLEDGELVTGYQRLVELIGVATVKHMMKYLGLRLSSGSPHKGCSAKDLEAQRPIVEQMNGEYALVLIGGKAVVLKENVPSKDLPPFEFMSVDSFRLFLQNQKMRVGDRERTYADLWLGHPLRRSYVSCTFAPSGCSSDIYNFYKGFACKPQAGDCSKILRHLEHVVCGGNQRDSKWLLAWLAQIVQEPDKKLGTAVAIRGKKGTGKTIIGVYLSRIFGSHYLLVSSPHLITGRFNSHLATRLLLHSDEGFWAGDKNAEGVLKSLITHDELVVELKGKEPMCLPNYTRLLITSNADWVAPASSEERRFMVLDISDQHMQDKAYFGALWHEMNNGGAEALLYFLMNYGIGEINLRKPPNTKGLLEQKIEGLHQFDRWWLNVLQRGVLPCTDNERKNRSHWQGQCSMDDLEKDIIDNARLRYERGVKCRTVIGTRLRKLLPDARKTQMDVTYMKEGEPITLRVSGYEFPDLARCRGEFEKMIGEKIDWEDGSEGIHDDEAI
jgi:hypothetical protein